MGTWVHGGQRHALWDCSTCKSIGKDPDTNRDEVPEENLFYESTAIQYPDTDGGSSAGGLFQAAPYMHLEPSANWCAALSLIVAQ